MAKKKTTKKKALKAAPVVVEARNKTDLIISVHARYPDESKDRKFEYVIRNVHLNIPPARLQRMGSVILKGLQAEYGRGVKLENK